MIGDFAILGIEETDEVAAIKKAFRKRAKELHPDLSGEDDPLRRHASFVALCEAYARLLGRDHPAPAAPSRKGAGAAPGGGIPEGRAPAPYSDPAYAFYRPGMRHFMKIHPSQWNLDTRSMLNTKIAGKGEDQEIIKRKVMDLVALFPKAYYYFSLVVHEYPESEWAFDSREKMGKIEERIGRYRRIIESFSSWNVDKKDAIARYREKYAKHAETREAVRKDRPKDWEK
jgi:curved DNA-binding protein CbpA